MSPLFSRTAAAFALSLTLGQAAVPQKLESGGAYTSPEILATVGNTIYFTATDVSRGRELWRTDGTQPGTVFVKDIYAGSSNSGISQPVVVGNVLYFTADDGLHGSELWRTDGTTAGTTLVKDIFPGTGGTVEKITAVGSTLYFLADDGAHGKELWKSDGTETGTLLVKDIYPGASSGVSSQSPIKLTLSPSGALHVDYGTGSTTSISGTGSFDLFSGNYTLSPITSDGLSLSYFSGTSMFLYSGTWTGSASGTTHTFSPNTGILTINESLGLDTTSFNLSSGAVSGTGVSLTTSPGLVLVGTTTDGSSPVLPKEETPADPGSDVPQPKPAKAAETELVPVGSSMSVVSAVNTGNNGNLTISGSGSLTWTGATTYMGSTLVIGPPFELAKGAEPELVTVGDILYFAASDGGGNLDLWKSDGTESGTVKVKTISQSQGNAGYPSFMKALGDKLCFFSYDQSGGGSLWISDGTESGTYILHKLNPTGSNLLVSFSSSLYAKYFTSPFIIAGDYIYFYGSDGVQTGLWCTDGTVEGTECANPNSPEIRDMVLFKDTIYISAPENELWTSDGTEEGTVLVQTFAESPVGSVFLPEAAPQFLQSFGNKLYFAMSAGDYGYELWSTDGLAGGSRVVKDLYPGIDGGLLPTARAIENTMYFAARDGSGAHFLWKLAPDSIKEAAAPLVTSQAAAGLTFTGAQIKGTVNPKGSAVTMWFEYGNEISLNKTTPVQTVKASTKTTSVAVALKGLLPGNDYSYRLVVQNKDRISYGSTLSFMLPEPPSLDELALSGGSISFSPSVFSYNATVPASQASISLIPTAYSDRVTITVNGSATASGSVSKPVKLKVGKNKITVVVASKDVKASVGYTVTVTRLK